MKKVLIISGTPRKSGNSDVLCDEFCKGALEGGNIVEKISLREKKIGYCIGCDFCKSHNGTCVFKDDMAEVLEKLIAADVLVFASPVYFYSIDAQMKAMIDRSVAKYTDITNKELYYIMTAAENAEETFAGSIACFRGYRDCLDGSEEKGMICAGGVWQIGEINGTIAMKKAYNMGKSV